MIPLAHRKSIALHSAVVAALSLSVSPVSMSATSLALEEVVVTARKVEEDLQRTPIAVSSLSEQEMDIRGVLGLVDVGDFAPNVNLSSGSTTSGSSSGPTIFIRGIGQRDFVNTADPGVGIYLDGVYIGRSLGSLLDMVSFERVEVLRGPQGTLFGRNTIGGAINVVTKRPDLEAGLKGNVAVTVGEFNHYEGRASVNVPLGDRAAGHIAGLIRKRDGFVDALQYDDLQLGEDDSMAVVGSLRFQPSSTLTIDVSADLTKEDESPAAMVGTFIGNLPTVPLSGDPALFNRLQGAACATPAQVASSLDCYGPAHLPSNGYTNNSLWTDENGIPLKPSQELDAWGGSVSLTWDTGIGEFTSITAYRDMESSFYNDIDLTPFPIFHNSNLQFDQDQFSQELRFSTSLLDDRLAVTAGVYYFDETSLQVVGINRFGGPPPIRPNPNGSFFQDSIRQVDNEALAGFGQATYDFSEALHLTLGLRYTREEKDFTLTLDRLENNGTILGPISGSLSTSELMPMATLGWDVNDTVYAYGTFSQGFRSGGFPTRFTGSFPEEIPSFDPEYVDSFELGLKMELFENRLRWNLAAFFSDYTDIQIGAAPVNPEPGIGIGDTEIDNLAGAEIWGIESEMLASLTDNLRLDLVVGWADSEISEVEGGGLDSSGIIIDQGDKLPFTDNINATLGLTMLTPLADNGELRTRVDVRYVGDQSFRAERRPETTEDAFTNVNASVTYMTADDGWEVVVGVRNLTNSDHFLNKVLAGGQGSAYGFRARPRAAYMTVRHFF